MNPGIYLNSRVSQTIFALIVRVSLNNVIKIPQ